MEKKILILLSLVIFTQLNAQKNKKAKTWTVKDKGVSYKLPDYWRSDPFSSSSVCDCSGTINDNNEWDVDYLGMVVYTATSPIADTANRNKVWNYHFETSDNGEKITISGIEFIKKKGLMKEGDEENETWQYVSVDTPESSGVYIIIYFWGQHKKFIHNEEVFLAIINSIRRQ